MQDERDDTTATFRDSADVAAIVSASVAHPALTIVWSADEPHRVGESAVFSRTALQSESGSAAAFEEA